MATPASEKLRRLLQCFSREDRLLILINPDPDSMASAMALKRLAWRRVASATIAHISNISRPDNLAMVRLLKLELLPITEVDPARYTRFAIVDSQPKHHESFQTINFDIIIDHHPDSGIKAPFVDIRPEYGATSTIMTQYLRSAKIKPSTKLATGLFYGIKTDTSDFERKAIIEDVKAFQFLFRYVNIHLARKIEQSEITLDALKYYRKALEDIHVEDRRIGVHLGAVTTPDVCVSIADFFMKIHDIAWVVVSGTYQNRLVIIVRNDGSGKDAGKLLAKSFGNLGTAGGHKAMARAEIPLENLKNLVHRKDEKKLSRWISKALEPPP